MMEESKLKTNNAYLSKLQKKLQTHATSTKV